MKFFQAANFEFSKRSHLRNCSGRRDEILQETHITALTKASAIAEGLRDALRQLTSFKLQHNRKTRGYSYFSAS